MFEESENTGKVISDGEQRLLLTATVLQVVALGDRTGYTSLGLCMSGDE